MNLALVLTTRGNVTDQSRARATDARLSLDRSRQTASGRPARDDAIALSHDVVPREPGRRAEPRAARYAALDAPSHGPPRGRSVSHEVRFGTFFWSGSVCSPPPPPHTAPPPPGKIRPRSLPSRAARSSGTCRSRKS
eukprot:31427-Pelagococcus_subviridis.AAC.10